MKFIMFYFLASYRFGLNHLKLQRHVTSSRHNEDGSYTYGYEGADGSFKIETKSPAGEVKGKYGYKDDTGKVCIILVKQFFHELFIN